METQTGSRGIVQFASGAFWKVAAVAGAALVLRNAWDLVFPRTVSRDRIYNVHQVARLLGLPVSRVNELVGSGELRSRQVDGRFLILGRAVVSYLLATEPGSLTDF